MLRRSHGVIAVAVAALVVSTLSPVAASHVEAPFAWAHGIGGTNIDLGLAIAVDGAGNTYVTGFFRGTGVDFNPGGDDPHPLNSNAGSWDIFVAKYDTDGEVIWAHSIGGTSADGGHGIAVDDAGNVYLTGWIASADVDFNPDPVEEHLLSSNGGDDIFVAKYDADGEFIWAYNIGGTSLDRGHAIAVDDVGNTYLTGFFSGTDVDFNPDPVEEHLLSSNGGDDIFVAKYDADGEFVWAHGIGGTAADRGHAIAVDGAGNTYLTGWFQGTEVDFNPDPVEEHLLSSNGLEDIFVAKYDADGEFVWAHSIGGDGRDIGQGIAVDDAGATYVTGSFQGTDVDFNPGGEPHLLDSNGLDDAFVAKYDTNGELIWAHNIGGSEPDGGNAIAVDDAGTIYVTGGFQEEVDFNPGGEPHLLTSNGLDDIFVARYTADGELIWAQGIGGGSFEFGQGIAVDDAGATYVTGNFRGTNVDFNPGGEPHLLSSEGLDDIFILKLEASPDPPEPEPDPDPIVLRLSGANRFATAQAISQHHHPEPGDVDTVVVATGGNFPDALAGAVAAAATQSPLLLAASLPEATQAELTRLDPSDILILGGPAAVPEATEAALSAFGATERLAGANRYLTAIAISKHLFGDGEADVVVVATGEDFPDALAAAPLAAALGGPVLLTPTTTLPPAVADEIERLDPAQIYVVGGPAAVSAGVFDALEAMAPTSRISGPNRYATAVEISNEAFPTGAGIVYVAVGTNFPDALAGAAQAAFRGAPVLLTPTDALPEAVAAEITRLNPHTIIILGGEAVISPAVETALEAILGI